MHAVTVLAALATFLPAISAQDGLFPYQTPGITANFTSPEGPRVDLSQDVNIAWEMPSNRSAEEYKWKELGLRFCVLGEDIGACWEFEQVDHHATNNYTWKGAADWFNETFSIQTWNLTGDEDFYFRGRLRTANSSASRFFESAQFRVDGVDGYENENGATRPSITIGMGLAVLLGGALML